MLAGAAAVNDLIDAQSSDRWINVLPQFHVGSLAILARAHLSNSPANNELAQLGRWNPNTFIQLTTQIGATLTSLIPTQVVDLVNQKLQAPQSLRLVFVGGSALPVSIYQQAVALGWNLVPTYGMTETSSQIATAAPNSWLNRNSELHVLKHLAVRVEKEGSLSFKGEALFTGYLYDQDGQVILVDPKVDGWFLSHDLGTLEGDLLRVSGRSSDIVKICGEWINLNNLDQLFFEIKQSYHLSGDQTLVTISHCRNGAELYLVSTVKGPQLKQVVQDFNQRVLPLERIRRCYFVSELPRSTLLKPQKSLLGFEIEQTLSNPDLRMSNEKFMEF